MIYDIFFVSKNKINDTDWISFKQKYPTAQKLENVKSYKEIQQRSLTKFFWVVWDDLDISSNFKFEYRVTEWDEEYVHVFKNGNFWDGVVLIPKKSNVSDREFFNRLYLEKKEIDIVASNPKMYNIFYISSYEEYVYALNESTTDLFWMSSYNLTAYTDYSLYFPHYDEGNRKENHVFGHKVNDEILYNGIILCSKFKELSKKEIEYRFPINRIEHEEIYSGPIQYEKFIVSDYDSFCKAFMLSKTEMFWMIPNEVEIVNNFDFDLYFTHDNKFDRSIHHSFKHFQSGEETYNGINLISKQEMPSKKEIDFRFIIERKEHDVVASKLRPYDIVFISYDEVNADENYAKLLTRFPRAKRVHKIKGIHNAHIEAAKLCDTDMFWVVDGDAEIVDDFNFDYEVNRYDLDCVFIWHSQNPINDLTYGYGGVKLLPKKLVLEMDTTTTDMTTSISKKIKIMPSVSNITRYDTDEFTVWRSAFRECAKLASRAIDSNFDEETDDRLARWCSTYSKERKYGNYSIQGARAGRRYGINNIGTDELSKINDFDWLLEQFKSLQEQN